jgi:hypothetical protein
LDGGPIDDLDRTALQMAAGAGAPVRRLGGGMQRLLGSLPRQSLAGLHIGRIAFIHPAPSAQAEQGLDLPHDFAAGGFGLEHLPDETLESQAQTKDPVPAVGALVLGAEQRRGQEVAQVFLELGRGGLADGGNGPAAQGGEPGAPIGKVRCLHNKYIYLPY